MVLSSAHAPQTVQALKRSWHMVYELNAGPQALFTTQGASMRHTLHTEAHQTALCACSAVHGWPGARSRQFSGLVWHRGHMHFTSWTNPLWGEQHPQHQVQPVQQTGSICRIWHAGSSQDPRARSSCSTSQIQPQGHMFDTPDLDRNRHYYN